MSLDNLMREESNCSFSLITDTVDSRLFSIDFSINYFVWAWIVTNKLLTPEKQIYSPKPMNQSLMSEELIQKAPLLGVDTE